MVFSIIRWREAWFVLIVCTTCIDGRSQRKTRDADTNLCAPLQAPAHGTIACGAGFPFYTCTATCDFGYQFPSGKSSDKRDCDQMFGEWFDPPGKDIPNCVPSCKPGCANGGTCILPNVCTCPDGFMGKLCQYPTSNCAAPPGPQNGKITCSNDTSGARCTMVCNQGFKPAWTISPSYVCYPDGSWSPPVSEIPYCVSESTVLNSSLVNISTNHPSTGSARCVAWGQDHYRTFDNKVYHYKGSCSYVLVKDAVANSFHIHVQNDKNCQAGHRCKREMEIYMGNEVISFKRDVNGPSIKWNGASITIPSNKGGVIFEKVSHYIIIRSNIGFQVRWDGYEMIFVTVTDDLRGKTQGLCGVYDGDQTNDFTTDTGVVVSEPAAFVTTWKRSLAGEVCQDTPQTGCSTANPLVARKASRDCNALMENTFATCHHAVDPRPYISACMEDCCSTPGTDCVCNGLQAYASECLKLDIKINWRSEQRCPMKCPTNQIYKECGSMCAKTCQSPAAACEDHSCIDGCFCPDGMVLLNDTCVQQSQCPCLLNGKMFTSGEVVPHECNKCTCTNGSWTCTTKRCDATCSAIGDPHYMTFDGKRYDFMGQCSYYLIHDQNYDVIADNIRCGHGEASCTKSITIHIAGYQIRMDHNHLLFVDGREITALPFTNDGIKIYMVSSLFMKAELANGITILWDGRTRAYITAPPTFINKTKGLCGTFDFNQKNDFKTLQGDIETSINAFGNRWKTVPTCKTVVTNPVNPCEENVNRKNQSAQYCAYLKNDIFKPCHDVVDPASFYTDCMYDMCACTENLRDCLCPMLGEYAAQCAAKGVDILWRLHIPECHIPCAGGQEYQVCPNECTRTCSNIANDPNCVQSSVCAEGCGCPANQTLDDKGNCITIDKCPCDFSGHKFDAGTNVTKGDQICTCINSKWACVKKPSKNYFDGDKFASCPPNEEYTPCVSDCQLTCENLYNGMSTCNTTTCREGCQCKPGFVKEGDNCVLISECPCYHGGMPYKEGETFNMECNKCTCRSRQWVCEDKDCPAVCSAYGDSHYTTFDGKGYEFQGSCDYVFAKSTDTNPIKFEITTENIPCGTTGVTCTRSISFSIGEQGTANFYRIQLIKGKPVIAESGSPFHVRDVGSFIIITTPQGITLEWDKGTRLYLKLRTEHKGKVFGLCGNFNGNQKDEFTTPQGGPPASKATIFADSWKVHSFCANSREITDTCEANKDRRPWAQQRCSVISSKVFEKCHGVVPYKEYLDRCVYDACACDNGGDCECVCTAVAAYAHQCAMNGVIVNWRTKELCPIPCQNCQTFSPCISTCPRKTCENRLVYERQLHGCGQETCVEGCAVKPCPQGQVYVKDGEPWTCVPEAFCNTSCTTINGKSYKEGEIILDTSVCRTECETCYCDGGKIKKFGICGGISTTATSTSTLIGTVTETGPPIVRPGFETGSLVTRKASTVRSGLGTSNGPTESVSTVSPGFGTSFPTISPGFDTGTPTVSPGFETGSPVTRKASTVSYSLGTGTLATGTSSIVSTGFWTGTLVTGTASTVSPGFGTGTLATGTASTVSPGFGTGTSATGTVLIVSPGFGTGTPATGTASIVSPGFGTGTPATGTASTVSPGFGTGTPATGTASTDSPGFGTGTPATGTASTGSPGFGTGTPATGTASTVSPGFGTGTPATGTASTVSPGFGTGTTATGTASTGSPGFGTGTPATETASTVSPGFDTGTPATGTASTVSPGFGTGTPETGTASTVSPGFGTGTPATGTASTVSPGFGTGTPATGTASTVSPGFGTGTPATGTASTVSPGFGTGTPATGTASTGSPGFGTGTPATGTASTVSPGLRTGTPDTETASTASPGFGTGTPATGTASTVSPGFGTLTPATGTASTVSPGFGTGTPATGTASTGSPGFGTGTPATGTASTVSPGIGTGTPATETASTVSPGFGTGTPATETASTVSPGFGTGNPATGTASTVSPGFGTGTPETGTASTVSPGFGTVTPTTGTASTGSPGLGTGTRATGIASTVGPGLRTGTPATGTASTVSPGFGTDTPATGTASTVSPGIGTGTPATEAASTASPGFRTGTPAKGTASTVSPGFGTGTPATGTTSTVSPGFGTGTPATGTASTVSPGFGTGTTITGSASTDSPGFDTGTPATGTAPTVSPGIGTGTPATETASTVSPGFGTGTPATGTASTVNPGIGTGTPATETASTVSPGFGTGTPATGTASTVSPGFGIGTFATGTSSTVSPGFRTGTSETGTASTVSPGFGTGTPATETASTVSPGFGTGTPATGTASTGSPGFGTDTPATGTASTVSPGIGTGTPATETASTVSPDFGTGTPATGTTSTGSPGFGTGTPATGTASHVSPGIGTGTPATETSSTVSPGFGTGTPATGTPSTGSPGFGTGTPATGTASTVSPGIGTGTPATETASTVGPGFGTGTPATGTESTVSPGFGTGTPATGTASTVSLGFGTGTPETGTASIGSPGFETGTPATGTASTVSPGFGTGTPETVTASTDSPGFGTGTPAKGTASTVSPGLRTGTPATGTASTVSPGFGTGTPATGTASTVSPGFGTGTPATGTASTVSPGFGTGTTATGTASTGSPGFDTGTPATGTASTVSPGIGTGTPATETASTVSPDFGTGTPATGTASTVSPGFGTGTPATGTASAVSPNFGTGTPETGTALTVSPGFGTGTPATGTASTVSPGFGTGTPDTETASTASPGFGTGTPAIRTASTVSHGFGTGTPATGTASTVSPGFGTGTLATGTASTGSPGFGTGTPATGTASTVSPGFGTGTPATGTASTVSPGFGTGTPATGTVLTVSPGFGTGTPATGTASTVSPGFGTGTPETGTASIGSPGFGTGTPATGTASTVSPGFGTGTPETGTASTGSPGFGTGTPETGTASTGSPGFGTGTPATGTTSTVSPGLGTDTPATGTASTVSPGFGTGIPATGTASTVSPGIGTGTPATGTASTVSPGFGTGTPATGTASTVSPVFGTGTPATGKASTVSPGFGTGTPATETASIGSPGFGTGTPATGTASTVSPGFGTGTPETGTASTGSPGFGTGTPETGTASTGSPGIGTGTPATGTASTVSPGFGTGTPATGTASTVSPGFGTGTPETGTASTVSPGFGTGTPATGTASTVSPGFGTDTPATETASIGSPGFGTGTPATGTASTVSPGFGTGTPETGTASTGSPGFGTGTPETGTASTGSPGIGTGTPATGTASTVSPGFGTGTPATGTASTVSPGFGTGTPETGTASTVSPGFGTGTPATGTASTVSPGFGTDTPATETASIGSPGFGTGTPATGTASTVSPGFGTGTPETGTASTCSPGFGTGTPETGTASTGSPGIGTGTPATGTTSTVSPGFGTGTPATGTASTVSPGFGTGIPATGTASTVSPGIGTGTPATGTASTVSPGFGTGTPATGTASTVSPVFGTGTPATGKASTVSPGFGTGTPATGTASTVSPGFGTDTPATGTASTVSPGIGTGTPATGKTSNVSPGVETDTSGTGTASTVSPGIETGTPATTNKSYSIFHTTTTAMPEPNFHFPVLCREKMGVEEGYIKQSMITVSSSRDGNVSPQNSALNSQGAWLANKNDGNQYIQVKFLSPQILTGLITQGNAGTGSFVASYVIYFSNDGFQWTTFTEIGQEKVFKANTDGHSKATNWFEHAIRAQYIRVVPRTWQGGIALRLELLGCYQGSTTVVPPLTRQPYPSSTTDSTNAHAITQPVNETGYNHVTPCFEGLGISACPSEGCQDGLFCDGLKCVKKEECTCMVDGQIILPGRFKESSTCDTCRCIAGEITCTPFRCPQCDHGLSMTVNKTTCQCGCEACEVGQYRCGSGICIANSHRCDGIIDCIDDEIGCAFTPMFTPPLGNTATPTIEPLTGMHNSPTTKHHSAITQEPERCQSGWSVYFNRDKPDTGDGDREMLSKKELHSVCGNGKITGIECTTSDGIPSYSTGEIMQCSIEGGSVCLNDDNFPVPCSDYKIRYFCTCADTTTNPTNSAATSKRTSPTTTVSAQPPATDSYVTAATQGATMTTVTVPALCQSRWSSWINKDRPTTGDGDREIGSKTEKEAFCGHGFITGIECVSDSGIPSYSTGEIMQCSIEGGSVCLNADNFPVPCSDYKIRYFCTCTDTQTPPLPNTPVTGGHISLTSHTTKKPYGDQHTTQTLAQYLSTEVHPTTTMQVPLPCQEGWSTWINRDSPNNGTGDIERMTQREMSNICSGGRISEIECITSSGIPSYSTGEIISCSVNNGLECLNENNFPVPCSDYKVRYFCSCVGVPTLPPPRISTDLPTLSVVSTQKPDFISPNTRKDKTTVPSPVPNHVTNIPVTETPCVPENCPTVTRPTVKVGEVLRVVFDDQGCCTRYEVFCKQDECSPPTVVCPTPMVLQPANPTHCCPTYRCMCPLSCPALQKPNCTHGSDAVEIQVGCNCTQFACVSKSLTSTCTYMTSQNTSISSSSNETRIYQIGDSWSDGQCKHCTCVDRSGKAEISCKEKMCPVCHMGYRSIRRPGECCGKCEPFGCLINGTVYMNGQIIPSNEPCYTKKCVYDTQLETYTTAVIHVSCPSLDTLPTCLNNESSVDSNGCCLQCIPAVNSSCMTCKPRLIFDDLAKTAGYFTITDSGETCRNLQPVPDLKECSGYCDSRSTYSHVMQGYTNHCNCCQATRSESRKITLTCNNGQQVQKTYAVPTACGCSACPVGQK